MVPKRRFVERETEAMQERHAPAVVLPFPARDGDVKPAGLRDSAESTTQLPSAPSLGDRPTLVSPALREWLRVALIVSLSVHAVIFIAFQLRFEDDLERAAGAAAALASDGSTNVLVEIVTTAALPSAPAPADASEAEADEPVPTQQQPETEVTPEVEVSKAEVKKLIPLPEQTDLPPPVFAEQPQELPKEAVDQLIPLPDTTPLEAPKIAAQTPVEAPRPVATPIQNDAERIALPEEENAPPLKVETAKAPEAPASATVVEEPPPMPLARQAPPPPEKKQAERKQVRASSPNQAAAPSQAAGANSTGRAGAGGLADAGGRAAVSSYQAQVLAHLARHRVYPPEARAQGLIGVARVTFSLGRNGQVLSVSLAGSSGERILDDAAVGMVRRASPFPVFPAALTQARMNFGAPIRFDLR